MKREFTVEGCPIPKGSTKSFVINGRAATTNANPKTKDWEMRIASECQAVRDGFFVPKTNKGGGVRVSVDFHLPRPVSAKKRRHMVVKPDIDKLARAVLDAITGLMFEDDSQVISLQAGKYYIDDGPPYAKVIVEEVD